MRSSFQGEELGITSSQLFSWSVRGHVSPFPSPQEEGLEAGLKRKDSDDCLCSCHANDLSRVFHLLLGNREL